jgi:hypothetical protein
LGAEGGEKAVGDLETTLRVDAGGVIAAEQDECAGRRTRPRQWRHSGHFRTTFFHRIPPEVYGRPRQGVKAKI